MLQSRIRYCTFDEVELPSLFCNRVSPLCCGWRDRLVISYRSFRMFQSKFYYQHKPFFTDVTWFCMFGRSSRDGQVHVYNLHERSIWSINRDWRSYNHHTSTFRNADFFSHYPYCHLAVLRQYLHSLHFFLPRINFPQ